MAHPGLPQYVAKLSGQPSGVQKYRLRFFRLAPGVFSNQLPVRMYSERGYEAVPGLKPSNVQVKGLENFFAWKKDQNWVQQYSKTCRQVGDLWRVVLGASGTKNKLKRGLKLRRLDDRIWDCYKDGILLVYL